MSLRVWLPLNGTLDNQGLDDVVVTNNGATIDNNGKIGKCYSFNGTSSFLNLPSTLMTDFTECSVCFWLKINAWNSSYETYFQAGKNSSYWADYIFGILRNSSNSTICFTIGNGSSASNNSYITSARTVGEWCHMSFIYSPGKCKIYLNGILDKEYTTTFVPDFAKVTKITIGHSNGNSYQTNCLMNDFRIYDHALSPLEVKHISQGLILHYPLNRNGWGQENLIKNNLLRKSGNANGITFSNSVLGNEYISISGTATADINQWLINLTSLTNITNTTITISTNEIISNSVRKIFLSTTKNGNWYRDVIPPLTASKYFTVILEEGETPRYLRILSQKGQIINSNLHFKLEIGDKPTPWCPNEADELYDKLGLNDNVEYDTSGFCNNGTRTGTFSWTSDTPKYQVSSVFDSNSIIDTPVIITSTNLISQYTAAVWIKRNNIDTTNNHCFFTGPIELFIQGRTSRIRFYWSHATSTSSMANNTWDPSVTINNSIWTHIVVTFADGVLKCYINGELSNTSDRSSTGQYIYGNRYHTIGSYHDTTEKFIGQICDVRAYATALSAEDVKSLYNNSAYIDNQGNIYGAIYEEV